MTSDEYREIRQRMGLTQEQLARELGVTSMTVSRRERGETEIDGEATHALKRLWERHVVGSVN